MLTLGIIFVHSSLYLLKWGFLLNLELMNLVCHLSPEDPISLSTKYREYRYATTLGQCLCGVGGLNSHPYTCVESTLSTKPYLQPRM